MTTFTIIGLAVLAITFFNLFALAVFDNGTRWEFAFTIYTICLFPISIAFLFYGLIH